MRLGAVLVGCLLLTTAFAGCMGSGSSDEVQSSSTDDTPFGQDVANETNAKNTTPEDTGPWIQTKTITGTVEGGATPAGFYYCAPLGTCESGFEFEVAPNQTDVLIEATWNQSVPADMDVDIPFDKCEAGGGEDCPPESVSGESPLRIEATGPDFEDKNGTWSGFIYPGQNAPSTIEYTIYVSLVSEGDLPRQYSNVQR